MTVTACPIFRVSCHFPWDRSSCLGRGCAAPRCPGFMVDPGYPRAACQVRTPADAAAHDRGDRQALRVRSPPSPVWAGHVPEAVKQYLISTKRAGPGAVAPRFCRHDGTSCRQEPTQPSIVPTRNPRWEPVFGIRVHAGTGETSGTSPSCPRIARPGALRGCGGPPCPRATAKTSGPCAR